MPDRQASIYPPQASPADKWATTILGHLKGSLVQGSLDWCWATKYVVPWTADPVAHGTPGSHAIKVQGQDAGRFLKLRYRATATTQFETKLGQLAAKHGWHLHLEDYDLVGDLGSDRYVPTEQLTGLNPPQNHQRRTERAEALALFLHHCLLLTLDTLVKAGHDWRFEHNTHVENPTGTTFQSIVHLVCNLTDARTLVRVQTPLGITEVKATF